MYVNRLCSVLLLHPRASQKNLVHCLASNTCFQCKPNASLGAHGAVKQPSTVRTSLLFDTHTLIEMFSMYTNTWHKQQNEGGALKYHLQSIQSIAKHLSVNDDICTLMRRTDCLRSGSVFALFREAPTPCSLMLCKSV